MCVRFSPLTAVETRAVLGARGKRGAHAIRHIEAPDPIHDARSGSQVPIFAPDRSGGLGVQTFTRGFLFDGKPNSVFNTRIETAFAQLERGRRGMWAKAIRGGRCLVPVRAFYEGHMTERMPSSNTGKPVRRQYCFRLPDTRAFLLAAVHLDGMFSIVTTEPNASVAPVHNRMPLVLGPGESSVWSGGSFAFLANKNRPELEVLSEEQGLSHFSVENVD